MLLNERKNKYLLKEKTVHSYTHAANNSIINEYRYLRRGKSLTFSITAVLK